MKTLAVFNEQGVRTFSVLSSHGHEWLNWRRYLYQTAQIVFPEVKWLWRNFRSERSIPFPQFNTPILQ